MSRRPLLTRIEDALPGRAAAFAILLFVALCWAGTIIAVRATSPEVPPLTGNFWRWAIAFLSEEPQWYHAVGIVLVFVGIYAATSRTERRQTG